MSYSDDNDESTVPYQPVSQPTPSVDSVPYQSAYAAGSAINNGPPYQPYGAPTDSTQSYPLSRPQQPVRPSRKSSAGSFRTGAIIALTTVVTLVFGIGLFAGWQFGHTAATANTSTVGALQTGTSTQTTIPALSGNNMETVREAVITNVRPTVVQINVTTAQGSALGSGVIIDKRGYIVTNNHVVNGAQSLQVVLSDGTKVKGQVTGTDPADDLAVVKITPPANMPVANLGDSSQLKVGQDVLAIGNPLGITQTVTNGIVSALNRTVSEGQGGANLPDAVQTDAPINPGNSGGALVDLQGYVIGIPTLTAIDPEFSTPASGVGFAIPSSRVKFVVPQIIQDGKVTHTGRAALGISGATVDASVQAQDNLSIDHGVLIATLVSGGAAQHAGLQAGDVIVQIGNAQVTDNSTLVAALITNSPGDTVAVKVYRGNQQLTINVTLGELQSGS